MFIVKGYNLFCTDLLWLSAMLLKLIHMELCVMFFECHYLQDFNNFVLFFCDISKNNKRETFPWPLCRPRDRDNLPTWPAAFSPSGEGKQVGEQVQELKWVLLSMGRSKSPAFVCSPAAASGGYLQPLKLQRVCVTVRSFTFAAWGWLKC